MITITINHDAIPEAEDLNYDSYTNIDIPEDATIKEAAFGFLHALEVEGYQGPALEQLYRAVENLK